MSGYLSFIVVVNFLGLIGMLIAVMYWAYVKLNELISGEKRQEDDSGRYDIGCSAHWASSDVHYNGRIIGEIDWKGDFKPH